MGWRKEGKKRKDVFITGCFLQHWSTIFIQFYIADIVLNFSFKRRNSFSHAWESNHGFSPYFHNILGT